MIGIRLKRGPESIARCGTFSIIARIWLLAAVISACSCVCSAADGPTPEAKTQAAADPGLYVKVQLNAPVKLSKLKPGDIVEGKLARDVYSTDHELFTAGSVVRMPVDHLEKRRRERNDHWPWVVNAFTPRHEPYPVFKTAMVSGEKGESALTGISDFR